MKEKEARKKWCPMVRASIGCEDNNSSNRGIMEDNRLPEYAYCFGHTCMMWRWIFEIDGDGYCGLAGKQGAE